MTDRRFDNLSGGHHQNREKNNVLLSFKKKKRKEKEGKIPNWSVVGSIKFLGKKSETKQLRDRKLHACMRLYDIREKSCCGLSSKAMILISQR